MTPEEALQRIRAAGECFVIFDAETGEVLEVRAKRAAETPDALIGTMHGASQTHGPVKGRFFDGLTVTLEALQHEVEQSRFVAGRVAIFSRWAVLPPGALVRILETDDFAPPMDEFHGGKFVIERIFEYRPEVLRPLVPRLERLAHHTLIQRDADEVVVRYLESRLAVLAGDFPRLKTVWERAHPGMFSQLVGHPDLLEWLGELPTRDADAIDILIDTVSYPGAMMFGPRCAAMLALGKIGAPAGPRAARGIRATIFDSSPMLVEVRERVLSRIETPETAWQDCPQCYPGKVPGRPWSAPASCVHCLGLGFVPSAG